MGVKARHQVRHLTNKELLSYLSGQKVTPLEEELIARLDDLLQSLALISCQTRVGGSDGQYTRG